MVKDALRICLWSGPRNVSTALLYAFAERPDTVGVDEPLYAHYLRVTGARHPGREDVLAAQDQDGERVIRDIVLGPTELPVLFCKMMAHHLVDLDWGFLERTANVILTRDPSEVLQTLTVQIPDAVLRDAGYENQVRLLRRDLEAGREPLVLDAKRLLEAPGAVLRTLCERLGLAFDPTMLTWPPGPKPYDGVWAPHWYHNVHRSTGFKPYKPKTTPFPDRLEPLLDVCRPYYEELVAHAITGS